MAIKINRRKFAAILLVVGIISIALSGVFLFQGFSKSNLIIDSMRLEKVTYAAADGTIDGIIDTPQEAQAMADILREHRLERYGYYSELDRNDPNRDNILKAITMENSLNLAVLAYGLTDVVKAIGVFMTFIGLAFVTGGVYLIRSRETALQRVV